MLTHLAGRTRSTARSLVGRVSVLAGIAALLAGCQSLPPPRDIDIANGKTLLSKALESKSQFYTIRFRNDFRIVISNLELKDDQYCYVIHSQRNGTSFSDDWLNYDGDGSEGDDRCVHYLGVLEIETRDARR